MKQRYRGVHQNWDPVGANKKGSRSGFTVMLANVNTNHTGPKRDHVH